MLTSILSPISNIFSILFRCVYLTQSPTIRMPNRVIATRNKLSRALMIDHRFSEQLWLICKDEIVLIASDKTWADGDLIQSVSSIFGTLVVPTSPLFSIQIIKFTKCLTSKNSNLITDDIRFLLQQHDSFADDCRNRIECMLHVVGLL